MKSRIQTVTLQHCSIPCSAAESLNTVQPISQSFLDGLSWNFAWLLSQSRDSFRVTQQMGRDYSERDATTVKRTRLQLKGTWPSRSHTRTTRSQWLRVTFRPSRCRLLLQKSQAKIVAFCRTSAQEIWLEINDWCDSTHAHINDLFRYSRYRQIKQGNLHF